MNKYGARSIVMLKILIYQRRIKRGYLEGVGRGSGGLGERKGERKGERGEDIKGESEIT